MKGIFITGTDTEIGKTVATSLLARGLRERGTAVCPVKPVATGGLRKGNSLISEDVQFYKKVTGIEEDESALCSVCLEKPASPHLAARLEGKTIETGKLIEFMETLSLKHDGLLVEGIGGWLVPLAPDFLLADFAKKLNIPIIVVSANQLGTINHTLMTLATIRGMGMNPQGVIFTNPTPDTDKEIAKNNISTICEIGNIDILGNIPYLQPTDFEKDNLNKLMESIQEVFAWDRITTILNSQ